MYSFGFGFLLGGWLNFMDVVWGADVEDVEIFNTGIIGLLKAANVCGCCCLDLMYNCIAGWDKSEDLIGLFT